MGVNGIIKKFEANKINYLDRDLNASELAWNKHPQFKGVYIKHLVKGQDTNGNLSCHIVKVEPNCAILEHIHEGKIEIHEVIEGSGTCFLSEKEIPYSVGSIALIPADIIHKVVAGNDGIFLLAKFTPALL